MFEKTYIVLSPSYHGATLLSKLLNAHPEITALGDTYPSNAFDQTCGCGKRVSRCPFWQAVKADTGAKGHDGPARMMLPIYPGESGNMAGRLAYSDFLSFWAIPAVFRFCHGQAALNDFQRQYSSFLDAVHRHTSQPGRVFVDGVKYVSRYEALLAADAPIDGVIHMVRDPVDFVASSIRNTARGGLTGIMEHSLRYRLYHARARQACNHGQASITLGYESLAADIDGTLERLFRFLGVPPMPLAELRPYFDREWHFMGNSSLFGFDGVVRRSRHRLPRAQERMIRAISGAGSRTQPPITRAENQPISEDVH